MSITATLKFTVHGDTYQDLTYSADNNIAEFFEVNVDDVRKKFSYEVLVTENTDMNSDFSYEALIVVKGRDV